MKKEHPIRSLLGLKQEDIAMLLGVSRPLWGMYEIGKRDLPLPAKQLLAEMLVYLKSSELTSKGISLPNPQHPQKKLEFLLRENEHRQKLAARNIEVSLQKLEQQQRLLQLTAFLQSRNANKKTDMPFAEIVMLKAARGIDEAVLTTLAAAQYRLEMLKFENELIETTIRNIKPDNADLQSLT